MAPDEPTGGLENLWTWVDEDDDVPVGPDIDPTRVTAVMVVHNAWNWLPRQLLSLARLHPRPGRIIAVDNGSTDDGPALLESARAEGVLDDVVDGDAGFGFGQAVAAALGDGPAPDWVWLLHDDSAPKPDALAELLLGIRATDAAVVVPKLLQLPRRNYPDTLAEVGQSITSGGRRVLDVEEGEIDQHQTSARPVLGGSTAGMLVRGDVWDELGGLAPELPLHRDGVDLGWRAGEAGHLVTTWPGAALVHRQAGRLGERQQALARTSHELDRLAALRVAAARGPAPRGTVGLVAGSWLRALGFLLLKAPSTAAAELRAARRFAATADATAALRARSRPDAADLADLLPDRFWGVRHAFDTAGNALAERYRDITSTSEGGTGIDELTGDDFAGSGTRHRRITSPLVALFAVLALAGAVAGRTLLGSGPVAGGGMMPAPANLTDAWATFLTPVVGVAGANAPWLGFNAFFSTFFLASPAWFAFAALLLAPLLAAFAAHKFLKQAGADRTASSVGGALWAGAVICLGLVTAGDMSGMVLAIAGPMLARSIHRAVVNTTTGAERLRAPAGVAFWLVAVSVAWPFALAVVTVAGLVWLAREPHRWTDMLIGVGLPWLFLVPWLPTLARWPGRILTGADPLAWPAYPPASTATLVGRILPSGLPLWLNIVFFGVLGLAALAGLLRVQSSATRFAIALGIGVPLLVGVLLSRLSLEVNGGQSRALLSGWALLVVAALLVPVLLPQVRRDPHEPLARPTRVAGALLACAGLLAAGTWAVVGFRGPVQQSPSELPGYARDVMASTRDTRVLMIDLLDDNRLSWNVVDHSQPVWGTGERNPAGAFATEFAGLVQAFSGGTAPEDLADRLTSLGVGHVWMKGFDADRMAAIGNAAGLSRAAASEEVVVWTVLGQVSRAQLIDDAGASPLNEGQVQSGADDRWILLAEEPDPRWRAVVGGTELDLAVARPPVTFELPADASGELTYGLRPEWGGFAWQLVLLAGIGVLALPTLSGGSAARRGAE